MARNTHRDSLVAFASTFILVLAAVPAAPPQAVNAGEMADAVELLADDAVVNGQEVSFVGAEAAVRSLVCIAEVSSLTGEGDTITAELTFTGTSPLAAGQCEPGSGGVTQVTVRDGRIASIRDTGHQEQQP